MRILYISSENVPGNVGGSVRSMEICRSLRRLGHSVTIFANRSGDQKRKETLDGVRIIRSKIRFGKTLPIFGIKRLDIFDEDFDIVIERYSIFGGIGTLYAKFRGKPLVLEVNAPHLEEAAATNAIKGRLVATAARKWMEIQFRSAAKIITTKKALAKGYEEKAIEMQLGGVNIKMFSVRLTASKAKAIRRAHRIENSFVIAFHGAFTKWHGIVDLMKAAKIVQKKDEKIKFLLIGGGELEELARKTAGSNCIFAGRKDYNEMPYYLAACDAGVAPFGRLPKHLKGVGFYWSPMKIFEYLAMGLPVITADYKELRAIVGGAGIFYKPGDHNALASAIIRISKNRIKQNASGAKKYSWDAQAKHLERVLEGVLKEIA